jgi:hypothetical protein
MKLTFLQGFEVTGFKLDEKENKISLSLLKKVCCLAAVLLPHSLQLHVLIIYFSSGVFRNHQHDPIVPSSGACYEQQAASSTSRAFHSGSPSKVSPSGEVIWPSSP